MDNLSESNHKVNTPTFISKIGDWYERHWLDIAIFILIFLAILALIGYFRLRQLTPEKQPIRLEYTSSSR